MDCCCCSAVTDEMSKRSYREAQHAVDAENVDYFGGNWWLVLTNQEVYDLFRYAMGRNISFKMLNSLLNSWILKSGFEHVFTCLAYLGVNFEKSQVLLRAFLDLKPENKSLVEMRFGFSRKSVLHVCADTGNLVWLEYFIKELGFSAQPLCWQDRYGLGPLYYAAARGRLGVVRFLVLECGQSPTQQSGSAIYKKSPIEIAKEGPVKDFLQGQVVERSRKRPVVAPARPVVVQGISSDPAEDLPVSIQSTETSPLLSKRK